MRAGGEGGPRWAAEDGTGPGPGGTGAAEAPGTAVLVFPRGRAAAPAGDTPRALRGGLAVRPGRPPRLAAPVQGAAGAGAATSDSSPLLGLAEQERHPASSCGGEGGPGGGWWPVTGQAAAGPAELSLRASARPPGSGSARPRGPPGCRGGRVRSGSFPGKTCALASRGAAAGGGKTGLSPPPGCSRLRSIDLHRDTGAARGKRDFV